MRLFKSLGLVTVAIALCSDPSKAQNNVMHLIATLSGDSLGDQFARVISVGDVNGDGYDDILVGAWAGGYAKLYFGGPSFDTNAAMVFRCDQRDSEFGAALAGGMDFNGDGYPDFAIGAPYYSPGGTSGLFEAGAVFIYFGGPTLHSTPDWVVMPGSYAAHFGTSIAFTRDLNGDGYPDLVVGTPDEPSLTGKGRLYIYYGGPSPDTLADQIVEGVHIMDSFGESVASVGDLNGDGLSDLIVGAPQSLTPNAYGLAYLVFGSPHMSLDTTLTFGSDAIVGNSFGRCVAALGDIDGDGHPDFAVLGLRQTKIYLGAKQFSDIQTVTIPADSADGWFAYIAGGGNIIGDANSDVLLSNQLVQGHYWGNVRCLAGANPFIDTIAFQIEGPHENNGFGCSMAIIPGLTGKACVAIGDDQFSGTNGPGRVFVYEMGSTGDVPKLRKRDTPRELMLDQNYPNPFNSSTTVRYHLAKREPVWYQVFNMLGQCLANENLGVNEQGDHIIRFNARGVASGVYVMRVGSGMMTANIEMILVK